MTEETPDPANTDIIASDDDYKGPYETINEAGERIIHFRNGNEKRIRALRDKLIAEHAQKAQGESIS